MQVVALNNYVLTVLTNWKCSKIFKMQAKSNIQCKIRQVA